MRGELEFDSDGRRVDTAGAEDAVRKAELRADVARLLLVANWGLALWCAVTVVDLVVFLGILHRSPVTIVGLRITGAILIVAAVRFVRRPTITRAQLAWARGGFFAAIAIVLGMQCASDRGVETPLLLALVGIATLQAATSPMPLLGGLLRLGAVAVLGIGVTLVASPLEHAALVTFIVHATTILASVVLVAIGCAAYWRLRRQVFARRLVGRYRLVERIGQGGMGEVWRAHHPGLRRDVAIKILRSDRAMADQIARFEAEIAALSELSHPNIVRVYDSGVTDDGLCYYAMELLRGETLEARVRRAGPLDAETATSVMRQICRALAEAHDHGIVHRDLTPRNVFLDASRDTELAKLIDFGIAARTTGGAAIVVAGTPAYMPPEQARGEAATPAADLYALGAVWTSR